MDISFHHGLFGSLRLDTVDCTSVPAEHLASLASSVTGDVYIGNVRGCGLVSILDSVKSKELYIQRLCLCSEETQALVQAMESGGEIVNLIYGVTLDIKILREYKGQGKCNGMRCHTVTVILQTDTRSS